MTGRDDFTHDEWQILCQAPTSAGLIVSVAQRGGFFWEAIAISRTFREVRAQQTESQLLDDLVAEKPQVGRTRFSSGEEARAHALEQIRAAIGIVHANGAAADVDAYAQFVLSVADKVAGAWPEHEEPVSRTERETLGEIAAALGRECDRPGRPDRRP
jgi:hypothetical protein